MGMREAAFGTKRRCPMRHGTIIWTGPPHDELAYVCYYCNAAASEDEIKYRGFEFNTIPDFEIHTIMDLDLQRQAEGNPKTFGGF